MRIDLNLEGARLLRMFNNGLSLNNDLGSWRRNRSAIYPVVNNTTFMECIAESLIGAEDGILKNFVIALREESEDGKKALNFKNKLFKIWLSMYGKVVFVKSLSKMTPEEQTDLAKILDQFSEALNAFIFFPIKAWWIMPGTKRKHLASVATFYDYIESVANRQMKAYDESTYEQKMRKGDLVFSLLKHREGILEKDLSAAVITDEDITMLTRDTVLGGTDTFSNVFSCLLYHVAKDKNIQEKLLEDLKKNYTRTTDPKALLNNLKQLKYFDAVLNETLRFVHAVPVQFRAGEEDIQIGRHTVRKGDLVVFSVSRTHTDESIWGPSVNEFDPDRYKDDESLKANIFAFGFGHRRCPGQDFGRTVLKIVLIEMILNFEFSPADEKAKWRLRFRGGAVVPPELTEVLIKARK